MSERYDGWGGESARRSAKGDVMGEHERHAAIVKAESEAARALGNANAARTERSRVRWERAAQRWLDRANDLRGWGELTTPAGSRDGAGAKRERGA